MRTASVFLSALSDNCASLCVAAVLVVREQAPLPFTFHRLMIGHFSFSDLVFCATSALLCRFAFSWTSPELHLPGSFGLVRQAAQITLSSVVVAVLLNEELSLLHLTNTSHYALVSAFMMLSFYQICRLMIYASRLSRVQAKPTRALIVGTGRRAASAWRELRTRHRADRSLVGFVSDRSTSEMTPEIAAKCVCSIDSLSEFLLNNIIDEVIIALPLRSCYDLAQKAVLAANVAGASSLVLTDLFFLPHGRMERLKAPAFAHLSPLDSNYVLAASLKRVLDIFGALIGLFLLLPVFVITACAIKLTSSGPVFFVQPRFGHRRRIFNMYKFRSMVRDAPALMADLEALNEADGPIFKIAKDPRITFVGSFIRRTSIDELPQLLNVLFGDMSLVGPRPMSIRDVSLFDDAYLMRRFSAKPGMTGIWQVAGRSSAGFDQWIKHDFHYLDNWSLLMDLRILARTIPAVLKRSGAV